MKSVASCLLDFKDFQTHDATGEKGLDVTCIAVSCILSLFYLLFQSLSGLIIILYILCWLFSWKDYWISGLISVWILDSSLLGLPTKPYINLLSIANDSDHTVTWAGHSWQVAVKNTCHPVNSVFFTRLFLSCTQLYCGKGKWGYCFSNDLSFWWDIM